MVFREAIPTLSVVDKFLALENFLQAFTNVAAKKGSPGVDGESIEDFRKNLRVNISQLRDEVASNKYRPFPYKRAFLPKGNGECREIGIPAVRDRIVQHALLNVFHPLVEPSFSEVSFAYRPNLSYIDAVEAVARWRDLGYNWVLDGDITKFFDNIDHQRLLVEVRRFAEHPGILGLIRSWISVGVAVEGKIVPAERGVPQGAVVSPLLANIYLDEFDKTISQTDSKLVRYADDFVVLTRSFEDVVEAYSRVGGLLNSMGLSLHPEKTLITSFKEGFSFLGHGFLEGAIFPLEGDVSKSVKGKAKKKSPLAEEEGEETEVKGSQKPFWERVWDFLVAPDALPSKFAGRIVWSKEMATVYLLTQGTTVYKEHQRFVFWIPQDGEDNSKVEIPIREIERILAFGNVQFSAPVTHACLEKKIPILLLSGSGEYRGHVWSLESVSLPNQMRQIERQKDPEFQLQVSQAVVRGKLMNSKHFLLRNNRKRKVGDVELAIAGITKDILGADAVKNVDSLRGYEGVAAARYFPAFGKLIDNPAFSFSLRNRQPPTDPVNSLLSFGYTLLFNNVLSLIIAEGLSPYFGNFHYAEDGRTKTYLAFDLMEEFRSPIVDTFVLMMVNNSTVKPTDFDKVASTGGVYLSRKSRKVFLQHFEGRMNEMISHPDVQSQVCYRQAIQLQIRRYKRCLLHGVDYEPFIRPL